jgi:hypothetical protein
MTQEQYTAINQDLDRQCDALEALYAAKHKTQKAALRSRGNACSSGLVQYRNIGGLLSHALEVVKNGSRWMVVLG